MRSLAVYQLHLFFLLLGHLFHSVQHIPTSFRRKGFIPGERASLQKS